MHVWKLLAEGSGWQVECRSTHHPPQSTYYFLRPLFLKRSGRCLKIMVSFKRLKQRWVRQTAERSDRSVAFKRQLLQKGTPIFKKYNIRQVYLFGSVASGRCLKISDIDLYVTALPNNLYWQFRHELEEAVQLPIDLYTDRDDRSFVRKIVNRGEKIYGL